MKKLLVLQTVPALLLASFSGASGAAGFALLEQNASGIGNAYAGSAAVVENASTIFFNPAGMTHLPGTAVSLGVSAVKPSFKFSDAGSRAPTFLGGGAATGSDGGDAGDWGYVPNAYVSWAADKSLSLGLGISAPFGLATEYEPTWKGRYQAISFDLKSINLNPSVAYRVNDKVALGFGVNYQKFEAEYIRQATPAAQVKLDADSKDWGWNVGVLFDLTPEMKLGLSYRSAIKHKLEGRFVGAVNAPAEADVELPDTYLVSVSQKLSDRWEMLGDVSYTGWDKIQRIDIVRRDTNQVAQTLDTRFRNTWRVALGGNYLLNEAVKLKFGLAYDQSPVDSAQNRLVSLPDSDRFWVTTGGQFKPSKTSAIDIGLAYLRVKDTAVDNDQNTGVGVPQRGRVTGTYEGKVYILGAQYSHSF